MAFSASAMIEVRHGGADTNGGGYASGGTDWSQQNGPQYAVTDGVTDGTTRITSASASFGTDVVGNFAYVVGGTGSIVAGWYQIISRTDASTVVVDRTTGLTAGTGVTLNIGGALASPGQAAALLTTNGMKAWVKYSASVYALTTATAGAAGPASIPTSISATMEGYDATRGDRTANRAVLQWQTAPGSNTYACKFGGTARQEFLNLKVDGNSQSNASGFDVGVTRCSVTDCVAINCNQSGCIGFNGYTTNASAWITRCQASGCTTGFACNAAAPVDCDATACTTGFSVTVGMPVNCLARGGTTGFSFGANVASFYRCTSDGNTTGFTGTGQVKYISCIASNNTGTGYVITTNAATLINCAAYNNGTDINGTPLINEGMILTAAFTGGSPYVNQAGGDFRPNATAGAGALLRNAGVGVFGQTDNSDIGAVQHSDPTGGGSVFVFGNEGGL